MQMNFPSYKQTSHTTRCYIQISIKVAFIDMLKPRGVYVQ